MKNRSIRTGLVCSVAALLLVCWSAVQSQRQNPNPVSPRRGILEAAQKPKAPVREMIPPGTPGLTLADVNKSMKARRDHAWDTVRRVWAPVQVEGGQIPTWMTWYEQEDIQQLYKEMLAQQGTQPKPPSREQVKSSVAALLTKHSTKDLQTSLTSARLGKTLRQFTFPAFHAIAPNAKPSAGMIYYNAAFVKHLLANAESIAKCNPNAPPRPIDPNNLYAQCMDHEMPADAVMIKTAWQPAVEEKDPGYSFPIQIVKGVHDFNTTKDMAALLMNPPAGKWLATPWDEREQAHGGLVKYGFNAMPAEALTVVDEDGQTWLLLGMHIATKDLKSWTWTSLFFTRFSETWAWMSDIPVSLIKQWPSPFQNLGMCTVSGFDEGDPAPWSSYDQKADPQRIGVPSGVRLQHLADVIKAVSKVMNGHQWCANPYIEPNMARGNCIGCHQGSPTSFLPTTLAKDRQTNPTDFSFSFDTNRANIIQIRKEFELKQKLKPNP